MIITLPNGRQMEVLKNATQVLVAKEAIAAGYITEEEMYRDNKPLADAMGYKGPRQRTPQIQGIQDPTSAAEPFSGPFGSAPSPEGGRVPLSGFEEEQPSRPSSIGLAGPAAGSQGRLSLSPDATQFQRGPSAVVGTPPEQPKPQPQPRPEERSIWATMPSLRSPIGVRGMEEVRKATAPPSWEEKIGEFRNKSPELVAREGMFVREYARGFAILEDFNDQYKERVANRAAYERMSPARLAQYDAETGRIAGEITKWSKYVNGYESAVNQTISQDVDALSASAKAREFYTIDKNGAVKVDAQKVSQYVDNALAAYGVKDTPNMDMRDMWTKSAMASIGSVERQKAGIKKVEEVIQGVDISKLAKPLDIDSERKKIESIANEFGERAKKEVDAFDRDVVSPQRQQIEAELNNSINLLQKEVDKIDSIFSSGRMSREQYDAAYSQLKSQANNAEDVYKQKYSELVKSVEQRVAAINFRWNQSYRTAAQAEQDAYNASIDAFNKQLKATYESPEVRFKIKQAYKEGYQQQAEKEQKAQEKSDRERYEKGIDPFDMGSGVSAEGAPNNPFAIMPFSRQMARLSERYVKGLSSAVKSYGTALGSTELYKLGLAGENKWNLPQLENKGLKDLGSLAWFERQAELGGYMTPGIGATALTAVATAPMGGSGIAVTGRFLLSGFSGWASETAQITADTRSKVLEATGSIEKADKAAERAFDSQVAISTSYLLEGAPFIKLPFLKAGRVMSTLTGFGAEYGQELFFQEGPQQIAEKRIMAEATGKIKLGEGLMAAYDNFYKGVADMMAPVETITGTKPSEFEQLAVDLIGIGGMGAVGGYRDVGAQNRQTAKDIKSLLANDVIAERIKNGDFQWINSIVESRGEAFASSLVGQFHVAGQISNEQKIKLDRNIESAAILQDDVQRLGLKGDEALAYKALAGRASAALEIAKSEEKDIIKRVHEAEARELERQMESIAMGKGFTGAIITTPNGKKIFMSEVEFKESAKDNEFLETVAMLGLQRDGGIQITNYGPGSDVALTDFWESVVDVQNGMSRDIGAVNKRYGTVVDYVVNTSDPAQSGIKVMAKGRPEDKANAEALLYRLGYNVIGYTPPAKVEPITEEELVAETVGPVKPAGTPEVPAVEVEWSGEDVRYKGDRDVLSPVVEWSGKQVEPKDKDIKPFITYGRGDIVQKVEEPTIRDVINMQGRLFLQRGDVLAGNISMHPEEKGMVVIVDSSGNMYDIGTISEIGDKKIGDIGIEIDDTAGQFRMSEAGIINVRGINYIAPRGLDHIVRSENGDILEVILPRVSSGGRARKGEKVFTLSDAEEIAYEITLRHIRDNANDAEIEAALAEARQAVQDEGVGRTAGPAPATETKSATGEVRQEVTSKPTTDAVQERTTAEVGAQPVGTEVTGQEGRGGVGPGVQGPEAPQAGRAEGEVTPTTEPTAEGPVRPEARQGVATPVSDIERLSNKILNSPQGTINTGKLEEAVLPNTIIEKPIVQDKDGNWLEVYINNPKLQGTILARNGNYLFRAMQGRFFVIAKVGDFYLPFYISSAGTSGKNEGEWYPFFGYNDWLVKGRVGKKGEMEYSEKISEVQKLLNDNFRIPAKYFTQFGQIINGKGTPANPDKVFYDINTHVKYESWFVDFDRQKDNKYTEEEFVADRTGLNPKNVVNDGKGSANSWIKNVVALTEDAEKASKGVISNAELAALEGAKPAITTAKGPVRPEAPPTPAAAPAPATAPTPNKETVAKMKELDKIEEKMSSGAKKLNAPAKKAFDKMVAADPRIDQVKRANFDKAVTELEKSGKLKVRCP